VNRSGVWSNGMRISSPWLGTGTGSSSQQTMDLPSACLLVEGFVRLRMGGTICIVRVEDTRPNSTRVMAEVIHMDAIRPNSIGVMAEVIHMNAVRQNSVRVMAQVIRSNAANDRLHLRVVLSRAGYKSSDWFGWMCSGRTL